MDYQSTMKIVALVVIYGLVYLDRVVAFQMMIHRPLVISVIVGLFFGTLPACIEVGILLEILWVSRLPVGAAVPPDDSAAALFGAVAISYFSGLGEIGFSHVALVAAVGALIGEVGREADIALRRLNGRISRHAMSAVQVGDLGTVESCVYASVILWTIAGLFLAVAWVTLGMLFGRFFIPGIPENFISPFSVMYIIIPATGAVSVYQHLRMGRKSAVFHVAMASGAIAFLFLESGLIG